MTASAAQRRARYNRPRVGLRCLAPVRGVIVALEYDRRRVAIMPDQPTEFDWCGHPTPVVVMRHQVRVDELQHLIARCTRCGEWRHKRRVCWSCRAPNPIPSRDPARR